MAGLVADLSASDGTIMTWDIFVAHTQAKVNALTFAGGGLRKIMIKEYPGKYY